MRRQAYLWSLRRELWEYRSVWIAPVVVGAVGVAGFLATTPMLRGQVAALAGEHAEDAHNFVHGPYGATAMLGFAVAFLVAVFYCLDTVQGERRDRSVLFWKSLPLSDGTAMLAKLSVPMLVLPALVFVVTAVAIALMATISLVILDGAGRALMLANVQPVRSAITVLYSVLVIALWHAPIYGWLLLVSAWARRAALVWAVAPLLGLVALERILFQTWNVLRFLEFLLVGWATRAFAWEGSAMTDLLGSLRPGEVLRMPSLWVGLGFAAVCVLGAVRGRRLGEPL